MTLDEVRAFALSLPEAEEAPHHHFSSFRLRGKIFVTVPPEEDRIHVFVDEVERERAIALAPDVCEKLWWGKKVVGLKIWLATADAAEVEALIRAAWVLKAPKRFAREMIDQGRV